MPKGWAWCRLKSLCSLITDGTHQTPEYSESGYVFLSSTNVTSGKIDWSNVKYIPEQLHSELYERLSPQFGDILLAKNGTIGCVAIVDRHDIFDIYVSLALLRPFRSAINEKFLHRIIGAPAIQNFFAGEKKGIGLYNLHLENIRQTPIPLPPLAEQRRIVAQIESLLKCVDEIDKESETLEKSLALAKQKILDLAIRGKLVPQDPKDEPASELLKKIKVEKEALIKAGKLKRDKHESFIFRGDDNCYYEQLDGKTVDITAEIPFKIPESWSWCRLGAFTHIVMGQSPDGDSVKYASPGIEFHQGKIYFGEKYLQYSKQKTTAPTRIAPAGSVLICVRAPVGVVNITKREICIGRGLAAAIPFNDVSEIFLAQWLTARQSALVNEATGSTFLAVSVNQVKNLLLPIPPRDEQKRIIEATEQYDFILKSLQG